MYPQNMFACAASLVIATAACVTTAEATPTPVGQAGVSIGAITPHDGEFQLADKTDSYIRSSKTAPHLEATTVHHRHHHHDLGQHHPRRRRHHP